MKTPLSPAAPIQQRLMEFIRREFTPGYNHYNVSKLIGDASARQYFRLAAEAGESFILAVYPEPFDPEHFSFGQIHQLFCEIGVPVPSVLRIDGPLGIVLQEDLGNLSLQRHLLTADRQERMRRLVEAVDMIVAIQGEGSPRLRAEWEASGLAFDEEKLLWEFRFFQRHYLGNYRKSPDTAPAGIDAEFGRIARELAAKPRFLCHRDFHVRNLMLKDERLHVIDFQDARWGPASYDLVSLLKDSIELAEEETNQLIEHYLGVSGPEADRTAFLRQFHLMSVQRLLKALGTYGYQVVVRENFIYEQYMAGSLHRALGALDALPEFPAARALVERELESKTRTP